MKNLIAMEKGLLLGHIVSMAFGLAGLLLVLPHPEFINALPEIGKMAFRASMGLGGVIYIILGMLAVVLYAYRTLGLRHCLGFLLPAIAISLSSELLGTSTGFPFGHYRYLSGLGWKIAGLVPFTIPLSWFYLGFSAYIIARAGLEREVWPRWLKLGTAIALGGVTLMAWDFVLDPAMSQTRLPFWRWEQPGAFFGMPYQNFVGWFATGVVFMTVATLLWERERLTLPYQDLGLPLLVYLSNFIFALIMSVGAGIYPPIFLGILVGVLPVLWLYQRAKQVSAAVPLVVPTQVATVGGSK
jgi:putative membrane protein